MCEKFASCVYSLKGIVMFFKLTNFKWNIDPAITTATAYQFIKCVLHTYSL